MSRRRFIGCGAVALIAACTARPADSGGSSARPASPYAANARLGIWPAIVAQASTETRTAYAYAISSQQSLHYIPCYCGCGASGHQDNLGCYVQSFMDDGWVVLEPHATACGVCVGITLDVMAMEKRGEPITQIRRMIDEKWSRSGPGTPTRMP